MKRAEEYKRWRAERGEEYYTLLSSGSILKFIEGPASDLIDDACYAIGNYFQTEAEAQAAVKYLKALAVVRDDAKGFKPDWKDSEQKRFVVCFDVAGHCLRTTDMLQLIDNGVFGLPYFATKGDAKASIKKHKAEWLTIFGLKGESDDYEE